MSDPQVAPFISLLAPSDRVIGFGESRSGPAGHYTERHMINGTQTILVVDPNSETRAILARQLSSNNCSVLEAADGVSALRMLQDNDIGLVVSELYLKTGDSDCLIQAMRQNRVRGTRTLAHTVYSKSPDRAWAKQWGASGYLVQPTRTKRLRHVVSELLKSAAAPSTTTGSISRRDTLDQALGDIERDGQNGTLSIVFGAVWWNELTIAQRNAYRQRAIRARVGLRSDRLMNRHFVEVHGRGRSRKPALKVKGSPYRS